MSYGYTVVNPPLFDVKNPATLVEHNLATLNSTFSFPDKITAIVGGNGSFTYTPEQILGGYITRSGNGVDPNVETMPTASSFIDAVRRKLWILRNFDKLPNGSSIKCIINNQTNFAIQLEGNTNTTVCEPAVIDAGCAATLSFFIVGQTSLGGIDQVIVKLEGCIGDSCVLPEVSPLTISSYQFADQPLLGIYGVYYDLSWEPMTGAVGYFFTTDCPDPHIFLHTGGTANSAQMWINWQNISTFFISVNGVNECGFVSSSGSASDPPCFPAGTLVSVLDKEDDTVVYQVAIETVKVGDKVIDGFGSVNEVLALHRPLLGECKMFCINGEVHSSDHHPFVSVDKQFYTLTPSTLGTTYGRDVEVILGDGSKAMWRLHGLREGRVQTLEVGVILKREVGGKHVETIDVYDAPADTQLYNLVVSGSHLYCVNNYVVTGWPREDDFDYDNWIPK
jgi:hypothetical protein